jgi:hypothetical protein
VPIIAVRFADTTSAYARYRSGNSLQTLPAGTLAGVVQDSAACDRISAAVDSILARYPNGYWAQHPYSRSYLQIGPYFVVILTEELPAGASLPSHSQDLIFEAGTMTYLPEKTVLCC